MFFFFVRLYQESRLWAFLKTLVFHVHVSDVLLKVHFGLIVNDEKKKKSWRLGSLEKYKKKKKKESAIKSQLKFTSFRTFQIGVFLQ